MVLSLTSASYNYLAAGRTTPGFLYTTLPLLAMMNAFLDFVGVVNRQLPKKNEHRFISVYVTVYAGKNGGIVSYDTFSVLLPGDWNNLKNSSSPSIPSTSHKESEYIQLS